MSVVEDQLVKVAEAFDGDVGGLVGDGLAFTLDGDAYVCLIEHGLIH